MMVCSGFRRWIFAISFQFLGITLSIGQHEQINSPTASNAHNKIVRLSELFSEYESGNPEKGLTIALTALDLAKKESPEDLCFAMNLVSVAYQGVGMLDSSMAWCQKVLEEATLLKDSISLSKAYNNIGIIHFRTMEYDEGLQCFMQSANLDLKLGDYASAAASYMNIGGILVELHRPDTARKILEKALEIAEKSGDQKRISTVYTNLGGAEFIAGNKSAAESYYLKAALIQEKIGDYRSASTTYRNLAESCQDFGDFSNAIQHDNQSLLFALKANSGEEIRDAYAGLAESQEKMGDFSQAYKNLQLYMNWDDTVDTQANRQAVIQLREKYDSEQTKKANLILQQKNDIASLQNEKNQERLNNSKIIIWSSVAGILLLVGFAWVLFNRNKIKQRANEELSEANHIIREKNDDITASLEYASKIQEALLPTNENTALFSDAMFLLKPKDIVSGDFFWYSDRDGKKIFTAVDCTGHGVPGAFMSMIGNTFLHEIVDERGITKPSEILDELRKKVIATMSKRDARKDGMDMALCTLDDREMKLQFAGANNPLYIVQGGLIKEYKPNKQPVGFMPEKEEPFTNHEISVQPGDKIYVFSDGYADQFGGPKGKKFKYKQLKDLLLKIAAKPMREQKEILLATFNDWKGDLEQVDDVCIIGVCV